MKATGMTRPVDALGRIVIPKELRRTIGVEIGDRMEIFLDGDTVILRKYKPCCIFCGEEKDVIVYDGKKICRDCATAIGNEVK